MPEPKQEPGKIGSVLDKLIDPNQQVKLGRFDLSPSKNRPKPTGFSTINNIDPAEERKETKVFPRETLGPEPVE